MGEEGEGWEMGVREWGLGGHHSPLPPLLYFSLITPPRQSLKFPVIFCYNTNHPENFIAEIDASRLFCSEICSSVPGDTTGLCSSGQQLGPAWRRLGISHNSSSLPSKNPAGTVGEDEDLGPRWPVGWLAVEPVFRCPS